MRRTILIVILAALALVLPVRGASAGGNWLGFREAPGAGNSAPDGSGGGGNLGTWAIMHVGQEVVAHTGIYVTNPHRTDRLEDEGPFYAWLSPGDSYLDDTDLPADAIRLAPFTIRFDGSNGVPVSARFTVPAVPSGEYEVVVCNDPCTLSGFGEYVQGWITITQTAEEARLMTLARERKWNMQDLRRDVRRLEAELVERQQDLAAARGDARSAALSLRTTDRMIELLESENEALRAASERGATVPVGVVFAIGIVFVGAVMLVRRRRSLPLEIPDTVPDDLVERDRVGV